MNDTDIEEIYFEQLPLISESNRVAQFYRPEYADALEKDITDKFHQELKLRASSKLNLIQSFFGSQGTGKSYAMIDIALTIADYKGISLNINSVSFTVTDMLNIIGNMEKGSVAMLDEQISTSGLGSTIERNALSNIEMTVRAHSINLLFSAPRFIYHNFHYFLETWQFGNDKPIDWSKPIMEQWKFTKLILYDNKEHMLGFIVTTTPYNKQFLKEYEEKKDKFIMDVKGMRTTRRHETLLNTVYSLVQNDEFLEQYTRLMIRKKPQRLRKLLVLVSLKGQLFATEEISTLVNYLEYIMEFEPEVIEKVRQMKNKIQKQLKELTQQDSLQYPSLE